MISLKNYMAINESIKFTREEMKKDYEDAQWADLKEKKALNAKYAVGSNKIGDIQKCILIKMQELRNTQKSFDADDILFCRRLGIPARYKQFAEFMKAEPISFIEFMKEYLEKALKSIKTRGGHNLLSLTGAPLGRDWNYIVNASDKNKIDEYNNVVQFLKDNDPKTIANKESKENAVSVIIAKLVKEMDSFKKKFLKDVKISAEQVYDNAPKQIEKLKKIIDECNDAMDKRRLEVKAYWRDSQYESLEKDLRKKRNTMNWYKAILKKTKSEYAEEQVKEAEKKFDSNVEVLANRLEDKNFNIAELKVSKIDSDPKIFQLMISDGKKTMYARSIIAAALSDKVTAHYRFIITNRKDGLTDEEREIINYKEN